MAMPPVPGVVRQDVVASPSPTLLTGVPAFLGATPAGGPTAPQRLTLWPQFVDVYGDEASTGRLADAVRGFFDNDGAVCYVVRFDESKLLPAALADALTALDDLDDVDLVCAPDLIPGSAWPDDDPTDDIVDLQQAILRHCGQRGDRFAILDGVPAQAPATLVGQCAALAEPYGTFGAVYHPWVAVPGADGKLRYLPPSGHVAGVYSATDRRAGVHRAPANVVVEGIVDVRSLLSDADVATLYDGRVNCLRVLPGRGIRVWGARTAGTDPLWRDIAARRLIGTIGRWLERFMTGLVHEPNDIRLWVRIMRELSGYLDGLYQRGALRGRTADEAFFVKCDNETNPREVIEAGLVVTQIGVAPTAPAEFITVRVIHGASGVTVDAA